LQAKLTERHDEALAAEAAEAERAARAASGASTGRSLTVAGFAKSEEEANHDFKFGEGAFARRAARIAARAAERERELREAAEWAEANPEEYRKLVEAEERKEARNAKRRKGRSYSGWRGDGTDLGAYYAGSDAAERIGLDPQAEGGGKAAGRLTGPKAMHL
jgi:hypothetical protein